LTPRSLSARYTLLEYRDRLEIGTMVTISAAEISGDAL